MEFTRPFIFNGIRFFLGTIFLIPITYFMRKREPEKERFSKKLLWLGGSAAGIVLFAGASFQQAGMIYTTAGNAGFITSLYVILVPVIGLLWKGNVNIRTWIGVFMAATGLYLLSAIENSPLSKGDILVLISAFFFAFHVHLIGWLSPKFNVVLLSVIQFTVCGILSLIVAISVEEINPEGIKKAAIPILYSGIMSVGVAYTLQTLAQKKATPTHAALMLSSESVFALFGGWLILNEGMTPKGLTGCALMLAGIIISQVKKSRR